MPLVHNETELEMLRSAKRVFDPDGLFNPGKVIPDPVVEP
jgi:FAD/FMN-containing dehydrogenase